MKTLSAAPLDLPKLVEAARNLSSVGYLTVSEKNLTYLNIDDAYIHALFPFLEDNNIEKPDYFVNDFTGGAHITVIYPEENVFIDQEDLNQKHHFTVGNMFMVQLGLKKYYALSAESPSLLQLRKKYDLPNMLCFKQHWINFHITIGVCFI